MPSLFPSTPSNIPTFLPSFLSSTNPISLNPTSNPLSNDDINKIVEDLLTAKYENVDLIETIITSDGKLQILIAINSDLNLSTESIKNEIGEALEEELGGDVEVIVTVNDENDTSENGEMPLFVLIAVIAILFLCISILSIIAIRHLRKNQSTKQETAKMLQMNSVSAITDDKTEDKERDGDDSLSEDIYKQSADITKGKDDEGTIGNDEDDEGQDALLEDIYEQNVVTTTGNDDQDDKFDENEMYKKVHKATPQKAKVGDSGVDEDLYDTDNLIENTKGKEITIQKGTDTTRPSQTTEGDTK